ncbi:zinc finger protein 32-like isoform X3 [Ixodes scapularis]
MWSAQAESAKAAFNVEWQTTNHGDGRSILSFQKAVSGWWMEVHGGGKTSTSTTPATIPTTIEEPPGCSKVGSHSEVGSFDCERSKGDLSPPEDRLFVPQWKTAQVKSAVSTTQCEGTDASGATSRRGWYDADAGRNSTSATRRPRPGRTGDTYCSNAGSVYDSGEATPSTNFSRMQAA